MRTPVRAQVQACGAQAAHNAFMSDDQTLIPPSFTALYLEPGQARPRTPRHVIAERHELCEDLAQSLVDTARAWQHDLGITADDVLERVERGLAADGSGFGTAEAQWVARRLAELLG